MKFSKSALVAGAGLTNALAISERDTCSSSQFSGEVVVYSLNIVEYPIVYSTYITEKTTISVDDSLTVNINNVPYLFSATLFASSTQTVTSTVSTATVAAATGGVSGSTNSGSSSSGSSSSGSSNSGSSNSGSSNSGSSNSGSSNSGSSSSGSSNSVVSGAAAASASTALSAAGAQVTSSPAATGSSASTTTFAVAGGSAVGQGLNTSLFTATTTFTPTYSTTTAIYTSSNGTRTVTSAVSAQTSQASGEYTDWTTFKANGVNLGGWFEIEESNNNYFWDLYVPDAVDEWTFCETLGSECGPVMEEHYATFITTEHIDKLASVGVNFLRIPMTYAAWVKVPGSQLYSGNQTVYLQAITKYAIEQYGMRVVIGLHSLPGGANDLDIGEASGHDGWFQNQTNLAYTYEAIESMLDFIENSGNPWAFTISALNEASDNIAGFATPTGLTANGTTWIVDYVNGIFDRIAAVDSRIPVMLQDCFLGEEFWSPYFPAGSNLVIDTHIYYFAASGVYSEWANAAVCGQGSVAGGDGKFPVFIGEWALQVLYNNTFENRASIFNTQRWAWSEYVSGGAFWSANFNGTAAVDGEGVQRDYWSYLRLIDDGVITAPIANATYCT